MIFDIRGIINYVNIARIECFYNKKNKDSLNLKAGLESHPVSKGPDFPRVEEIIDSAPKWKYGERQSINRVRKSGNILLIRIYHYYRRGGEL